MKLEENHESQSSHMLDILQLLFIFNGRKDMIIPIGGGVAGPPIGQYTLLLYNYIHGLLINF